MSPQVMIDPLTQARILSCLLNVESDQEAPPLVLSDGSEYGTHCLLF